MTSPIPWVNQVEAKRGDFVDSFTKKEDFIEAAERMVVLMSRSNSRRKLVYTIVPHGRKWVWQIYLTKD